MRKTINKIRRLKVKHAAAAKEELKKLNAENETKEETDESKKPGKKELFRRRQLTARSRTNLHALAFLEASVLELERKEDKALKLLAEAAKTDLREPSPRIPEYGQPASQTQTMGTMRTCFEKVLEIDPNDFRAMIGVCRCLIRSREFESAAAIRTRSDWTSVLQPAWPLFPRTGALQDG